MLGKFQTLIPSRYLRPYVGRHRAIDVAAASLAFGRRAAAFTGGLTASFAGAFFSDSPESPEQLPAPDQTAN